MGAAPARRIQFRIEIGADSLEELSGVLHDLSLRVDRSEMSTHSVSGGVYSGYEHWLTIAEHPTHEEYVAELNAYLEKIR